ncbi:hypothetical protein EDD22DRAFT_847884 [Suillus occidentalis]|nr:hypothetical protein EDD22DRAFT_847884 [Suillus occidentalis]
MIRAPIEREANLMNGYSIQICVRFGIGDTENIPAILKTISRLLISSYTSWLSPCISLFAFVDLNDYAIAGQYYAFNISPLSRSWFSPRTSVLSVLKRLEDTNVTAIERRIATCPKKLQPCMNITELLPSDLTRNSTTKGHASPLYFTYYSTAVMYSWSIPSMWTIDAYEEAICLRGSCALFKQAGDNQFVLNSQQLALIYH